MVTLSPFFGPFSADRDRLRVGPTVNPLMVVCTKLDAPLGRFAFHVRTARLSTLSAFFIKDFLERVDSMTT